MHPLINLCDHTSLPSSNHDTHIAQYPFIHTTISPTQTHDRGERGVRMTPVGRTVPTDVAEGSTDEGVFSGDKQ